MRLPEGWRETTVGNIVLDLQPGFAQKPGEEDEGTTPQIRTHNVTPEGKIALDGIKHISASIKEAERYTLTVGDVIFNNTNSEEWVGKTAVFDQEGEYVFSNHMTRLRVQRELILPEYLASYLHLLWSMGYSKTRAKRWVSQAGIESKALAAFKLPLPPLPEQQRIVDLLRQAEEFEKIQTSRRQQLDLMIKAALDRLVLSVEESQWLPLGSLVETRYGTSFSADATQASGTPVLRIPNVMGGEVDTTDMKYVELPQAELHRLRLTDSDVLIVRSNGNPDYVGRSAPITEDIAGALVVYASYLIRLRTDTQRLLPEYLSAFLNSAFGRAAMRNAIRTTAGQSNLSGENLSKVRVPLPSLVEQGWFKDFWLEVRQLRRLLAESERTVARLRRVLTVDALSGDLTEDWRANNAESLHNAIGVRDALLRERGAKLNKLAEPTPIPARVPDSEWPTRHWLLGELSVFQRQVLAAFARYCEHTAQPLLAEDPDVFAQFCDNTEVQQALQPFGTNQNNRIRRTLSQLAALGLIAKVTLPKYDADSGEREYLKAFRPLRVEESTRMDDIIVLRKALSVGESTYHFTVIADFETSERAGAGGMFQVAELLDDTDKSRTDLVDQGKHYATLDELKAEIAQRLGVPVSQVELERV